MSCFAAVEPLPEGDELATVPANPPGLHRESQEHRTEGTWGSGQNRKFDGSLAC